MNKRKRFSVLKRFGFRCVYCGRKPPEVILEVDHRESRVTGGGNEDDNLVAGCRDCNRGKGPMSDRDDDGIVIVFGSDGRIDHKRSLKFSGLWSSISKENRSNFMEEIQVPAEVILADVLDVISTVLSNLSEMRSDGNLGLKDISRRLLDAHNHACVELKKITSK
jgi:hypothetical protein